VNAFQFMGFLLLLNLSISGMTMIADVSGGHFYDITDTPENSSYDISEINEQQGGAYAFIESTFLSQILAGAVIGVIAGSIVAWATRIPADSAYVYSIFTSFYWTTTTGTISILWGFTQQGSVYINTAIFIMVAIFTIVVFITFVSFFIQLVKGGWSSYT